MSPEVCALGEAEHTLCGDAFDAFETGDLDAPVVLAAPGQLVTCSRCRAHIDYVRNNFKRYRVNVRNSA